MQHMKATLLVAALIGGLALWYADQQEKASAASPQYLTAPIEEGELRRVITATGALNAIVNVEVGSQLSGQIAALFVDFNDQVKKGQPLAQLDQRSFKAKVVEAEAALQVEEVSIKAAQARLERAQIDALDSEAQRAVLKAQSDKAQVTLEAAQNELRRKENLRERQIGSAVELEDARTKAATAAATVREAEATSAAHQHKLEGAKADVRRIQAELETAIASLPQRQAQLHAAQIDLERTVIRSPLDGVVVGRNVNEGQTLATTLEAKTLFTIAGDLHQMQIEAKVDEADIGKIRDGQAAVFTVDAHPGRQFSATVRQVRKAPQVQQNVVTYTVVLAAANPDDLLLPGMTAVVKITINKTGPVLKVPLAALRFAPKVPPHETPQQGEPP